MFLNKMNVQKKILIISVVLGIFAAGAVSAKTQPLKVVGMAKFVLRGAVLSTTAHTITVHTTNTSKNAKLFDNKDKTLNISSKTTLTKNGKSISQSQIKAGNKVKVFGIFDKKTGAITLVSWIKVMPK